MKLDKLTFTAADPKISNDPLLSEALFVGVGAPERGRVEDKIFRLAGKFSLNGDVANTKWMIDIGWRYILESQLGARSTGCLVDLDEKKQKTYPFYSVSCESIHTKTVDALLKRYAHSLCIFTHCEVGKFSALLPPGKQAPEEVVEYSACEMLMAIHLLNDPKVAGEYFVSYLDDLVGNRFSTQKCDLMKKAPDILRKSLKDMPKRGDQSPVKNLLQYSAVIDKRLQAGNNPEQLEALDGIVKVIGIGLCRYLPFRQVNNLFLTLAE